MNKMKKYLLTGISYVLVATLAIGGTFAYLTSEDSDVNVMTLGNVSIEQHEYQRVENADGTYKTDTIDGQTSYVLEAFEQAKPLLPATEIDANGNPYNYGAGDYGPTRVKMSQVGSHGSMDVFVNENAQDKFVTVENTGKTDAYVRTIIAYELGSVANFRDVINTSCFMTAQDVWKVTDIGTVVIDGNNYFVAEYIYNGAAHLGGVHENGVLPAGDTTYPSLAQVYMKATATNEDCEAIDGNGNGTYDILVLSQAVQTNGFENAQTALDTAFGKVSEKAAEWFGSDALTLPVIVSTANELKDALKTKGENIVLTSGTYNMGGNFSIAEGVTLIGGKDVIIEGTLSSTLKNVEVKNVTFKGGNAQRWAYAGGTAVFENCTFDASGVYAIHFDGTANADIVYKNCDIIGWVAIAGGHNSLTFDGCRISGNGTYGVIRTYSDATIKNCTFDVDNVNTTDIYQDGIHAVDCTITVENCENVNGEIDALFNVSGTGKIVKK